MRWLGLGVILNRLVVTACRVDDTNVEIATTYIFGDYEDIEDLEIGAGVSPGFIELSFDGSELSIDRTGPKGNRFARKFFQPLSLILLGTLTL